MYAESRISHIVGIIKHSIKITGNNNMLYEFILPGLALVK